MTNTIPQEDDQFTFARPIQTITSYPTQQILHTTTENLLTAPQNHQQLIFNNPTTATTYVTTDINATSGNTTPPINCNNNNNNIDNNNQQPIISTTITTTTAATTISKNINMNIQPTSFTKNHLINDGALSANDELSIKKRREDLTRRPSYRKIFNDLTGLSGPLDPPPPPDSLMTTNPELSHLHHPHHQAAHQQHHPQNLPPPQQPMPHHQQAPLQPQSTASHHQQAQQPQHHPQAQLQQPPPHHQQQTPPPHHLQQQAPSHQQLHQTMKPKLTISPPMTPGSGSSMGGEEANKKRELRLQKNREAAKECRRKKKEYIKCLENRVAVLETQNKALIDELKALKDLYCKAANE